MHYDYIEQLVGRTLRLQELQRFLAQQLVRLRFIQDFIRAYVLSANGSGAVDENHVRHKGQPLCGVELHVLDRVLLVGLSHWEGRIEALNEIRDVGIVIERAGHDGKSLGTQFLLNATQDLSGFLAVRSSGENEQEAHYFAAVAAEEHLFSVGRLDGEFRRFARNLRGEGAGRQQCKQRKDSDAHEI